MDAHSDHFVYESEEAYKNNKSSLFQSLNGQWDFAYANKPAERMADFYKMDFSTEKFDKINVPGHIQLQGYDRCQYINTMYPWDGREEMRPPQVSEEYNPVGSYVKYFDLDNSLLDKNIILSFQGVEVAFYVWVNGEFVGYSEDTFTPSEFDITDFVQEKTINLQWKYTKEVAQAGLRIRIFGDSQAYSEMFIYRDFQKVTYTTLI